MPRRDGIDAASEIATKRIAPIVVLTAFSQRDLVERARDAGAMAYLVKPFQKSELIPAIELALARHAELTSLERHVDDLEERLEARKLIDRAKAAGVLRADFVSEDLLILLIANATIVHVTRTAAPGASRRLVALVLDAFGRVDTPALPAPPSTTEMASAMCQLAAERGCGASTPQLRGLP